MVIVIALLAGEARAPDDGGGGGTSDSGSRERSESDDTTGFRRRDATSPSKTTPLPWLKKPKQEPAKSIDTSPAPVVVPSQQPLTKIVIIDPPVDFTQGNPGVQVQAVPEMDLIGQVMALL